MKGLKRVGILIGIIAVVIGLFLGISAIADKVKQYAEKERMYTIEKTLRELGNNEFGLNDKDFNTAEYSSIIIAEKDFSNFVEELRKINPAIIFDKDSIS